jgi:hypothetical protein
VIVIFLLNQLESFTCFPPPHVRDPHISEVESISLLEYQLFLLSLFLFLFSHSLPKGVRDTRNHSPRFFIFILRLKLRCLPFPLGDRQDYPSP